MIYEYEDSAADRMADYGEPMPRKRSQGCRCFAPGEAGGSCPGADACPMCDDNENNEGE